MTLAKAKRVARARALPARRALPATERAARSRAICCNLATLDEWGESTVLAGFAPLPEEVDIRDFAIATIKSGRTYCLPRVQASGQPLAMHKMSAGLKHLTTGYGGILEPSIDLPRISLEKITAALVPSVSIDQAGNRLGFGQGFYDITFFSMPSTLLIAPIFSCQLLADLPVEEHDCKVDIIVTEEQIMDLRQ